MSRDMLGNALPEGNRVSRRLTHRSPADSPAARVRSPAELARVRHGRQKCLRKRPRFRDTTAASTAQRSTPQPVHAMEILEQAPSWLLRPLPANAVSDAKLNAKITKLAEKLPGKIHELHRELGRARNGAEYDVAANL